jgi:D-alanine-D-alanine ligase-like ATP-grasp enzyme
MIDATMRGYARGIEEDAASCEDNITQAARDERPPLRLVVLVYEDRRAWIARARKSNLSRHGAELASHWLLSVDKIERTCASLSAAACRAQVAIELYEIDDFIRRFKSLEDEGKRSSTLLWNITDGVLGFRGSHLVSLAELHGMPYFGCPPFAHQLAQDKFKLYSLCHAMGIRTAACALVENGEIIGTCSSFPNEGRYFVKPNSFGNKVGIGPGSLCKSLAQARHQALELQALLRDRAVVQSFIDGPEVRATYINAAASQEVAVYGFDVIDEHLEGEHFVDFREREKKYRAFVDFRAWTGYDIGRRERALGEMTEALRIFSQHVRVKDYFAVDFRLDAAGNPFMLDFNPGAFLYGDDVEGYTRSAFKLRLPGALLRAMVYSHRNQCGNGLGTSNIAFRV